MLIHTPDIIVVARVDRFHIGGLNCKSSVSFIYSRFFAFKVDLKHKQKKKITN